MNDATGWKRGEKGYGKDAKSSGFAKADFDRAKQQGPLSDGGCQGGYASGLPSKGAGHFKGYKGVDK